MIRYLIFLIWVNSCFTVYSQRIWYADVTPGLSLVPPVPLVVKQEGGETIRLWARYGSAPLKRPYYYSVRVGTTDDTGSWELEMNHLKVYLRNRPSEIGRFSISHGYNQLLVNRAGRAGRLNAKAGLGIVAAHPENMVRGLKLDENQGIFRKGYYISGLVVQVGVWKKIHLKNSIYLLLESKISAAYASVPVVNGKAGVPVLAFHLQAGPGFVTGR